MVKMWNNQSRATAQNLVIVDNNPKQFSLSRKCSLKMGLIRHIIINGYPGKFSISAAG